MPTLSETLPGLRETYPVGGTPSFFSDKDQDFDFEEYVVLNPEELFNNDPDNINRRIEDWLYLMTAPMDMAPKDPPREKLVTIATTLEQTF